jgi:MoaA/NifB/PqqE/SkfB family radical SAM enzyme
MKLLYTKFKIFQFQEKIDSLPKDIDHILPPIHIRIKPTNACAHNCWYCSYRLDGMQLGKDMDAKDLIPKDKIFEIIDDIIEMKVKAVTFSGGGDPFYYPYFLDTVRKLALSPVQFAALHNGAMLRGELAEIFAHRATWLRISIDGWDNKSYSEYRGIGEGEFDKVIKNLEHFNKLGGKCYLGMSFIIDKKNAAHVFSFIKRMKDIGVQSVKVSACIVDDDVQINNKYHQDISEDVKHQINKAMDALADGSFEVYDAYHELDERFKKDYTWCPYLQINPVIGADLNIYPCHDKAYNLGNGVIGSCKNQRFKDYWFSDKNNFFMTNPSIHCNHHCMANRTNKMLFEYLDTDKTHGAFV